MMTGVDRASGEQLDDVNIRYQINTFLIAGHETTSGLLSCTLYALLKHPDILKKAYEEVDRVLGPDVDARPTFQQVTQLHLHLADPEGGAADVAAGAGLRHRRRSRTRPSAANTS
jgi:cytochrome P450